MGTGSRAGPQPWDRQPWAEELQRLLRNGNEGLCRNRCPALGARGWQEQVSRALRPCDEGLTRLGAEAVRDRMRAGTPTMVSASQEPGGGHVAPAAALRSRTSRRLPCPAAAALRSGAARAPRARVLPACRRCCWLNWKTNKISGERNTVAVKYLYFSTKFDTVFHKTLLRNINQTRGAPRPVLCEEGGGDGPLHALLVQGGRRALRGQQLTG